MDCTCEVEWMEFAWTAFEIVGTIAFAISGALVGIGRRMDIFGLIVLLGVISILELLWNKV